MRYLWGGCFAALGLLVACAARTDRPGSPVASGRGRALELEARSAGKGASENGPRIWTISIGISKYAQGDLALRFADRDALEVDRFFASSTGATVPDERRVLLTNEKATRADLLEKLTQVASRTAPDDVLIVFLAMHGTNDARGDLYFVAHDTTSKNLVGTGLPERDIKYVLSSAPARRVILIADACHAGAMGLGGAGTRALAHGQTNLLLARLAEARAGTVVFSASSSAESSQEDARWGGGHGVFTHFLLQGLAGKADDNGDGLVSIRELYEFVYRRVADATTGEQHPELKGTFDNAMPLSVVTRKNAKDQGDGADACPPGLALEGNVCKPRIVTDCPPGMHFAPGTGCVPNIATAVAASQSPDAPQSPEEKKVAADFVAASAELRSWVPSSPDTGTNREARLRALASLKVFYDANQANPAAGRYLTEAMYHVAHLYEVGRDPKLTEALRTVVSSFERLRATAPTKDGKSSLYRTRVAEMATNAEIRLINLALATEFRADAKYDDLSTVDTLAKYKADVAIAERFDQRFLQAARASLSPEATAFAYYHSANLSDVVRGKLVAARVKYFTVEQEQVMKRLEESGRDDLIEKADQIRDQIRQQWRDKRDRELAVIDVMVLKRYGEAVALGKRNGFENEATKNALTRMRYFSESISEQRYGEALTNIEGLGYQSGMYKKSP